MIDPCGRASCKNPVDPCNGPCVEINAFGVSGGPDQSEVFCSWACAARHFADYIPHEAVR